MAALLDQATPEPFEIVVVVSGDTDAEVADADEVEAAGGCPDPAPRCRWFATYRRLSAAQGRNLGVNRTGAQVLAFTDADAVAEPGWLARLSAAVTDPGADDQGWCAVGSVANGTPESASGTTEYLLEFLDLHPGRPPESLWHGATVNLALTRSLLERLGPFVDASAATREVGSADTLLYPGGGVGGSTAVRPRRRGHPRQSDRAPAGDGPPVPVGVDHGRTGPA